MKMGDIFTNNLAIAIFLRGIYKKEHNAVYFESDKTSVSIYCSITDLKYHIDWNQLMSVVGEINNRYFKGTLKYSIKKEYIQDWAYTLGALNKGLFDADIKQVYNAVVNFVKNIEKWVKKD